MASRPRNGSRATTAPKGRPTNAKGAGRRGRLISPTMEWVIAAVLLVAIFVAIVVFLGDSRATPGHSGHPPVPAVTDASVAGARSLAG